MVFGRFICGMFANDVFGLCCSREGMGGDALLDKLRVRRDALSL